MNQPVLDAPSAAEALAAAPWVDALLLDPCSRGRREGRRDGAQRP